MNGAWQDCLRVLLISDGRGDLGRLETVARAARRAGVRALQVREPAWSARQLLLACERLRDAFDGVSGLLLVNDRADLVAAGAADGVQLGQRSLPAKLVRRLLGDRLLGCSIHAVDEIEPAARDGADFVILAPVFATSSKPGAPPTGTETLAAAARGSPVPVLALGGITAARVAVVLDSGALGVACIGAVFAAADPGLAAAELVEACRR